MDGGVETRIGGRDQERPVVMRGMHAASGARHGDDARQGAGENG